MFDIRIFRDRKLHAMLVYTFLTSIAFEKNNIQS